MSSRKLIPVVVPLAALLLLVAALVNVGAQPRPGIRIPPGEIVDSPNAKSITGSPRRPVPDAPALPDARSGAAVTAFDGSSLDEWKGITDTKIEWRLKDGRLQQFLPLSEVPTYQPILLVTRDTSFSDGSVEGYVYPTSGSPVGIVLRGSDKGYYRVVLQANAPNDKAKALLERVSGGKAEVLAEAPVSTFSGYTIEQWQLVKVTAQGSTLTVSVDGHELLSVSDNAFASGWAGVWTLADQGASFDNIQVERSATR